MRDHPGFYTSHQTHAQGLEAEREKIPWGSAAAQEAINRICQEVAARCQQVITAEEMATGGKELQPATIATTHSGTTDVETW